MVAYGWAVQWTSGTWVIIPNQYTLPILTHLLISRRATVPGLYRWGFLTPIYHNMSDLNHKNRRFYPNILIFKCSQALFASKVMDILSLTFCIQHGAWNKDDTIYLQWLGQTSWQLWWQARDKLLKSKEGWIDVSNLKHVYLFPWCFATSWLACSLLGPCHLETGSYMMCAVDELWM